MKSASILSDTADRLKSAFYLLIFLIIGLPCVGQLNDSGKNFTIGSGIGYNFSFAGGNLGFNQNNAGFEGIYGSWAQGPAAGIDFGMEICGPLYAVFSFNYLNGREVESSISYESANSSLYQYNLSHLRIPMLAITGARYYPDPSCCLLNQLSGGDRFRPYIGIGAGLALGARMKTTASTESSQAFYRSIIQKKSTTTFRPALVTAAELGMTYRLSETMKVYAGLECTSMSLMNSREKVHSYFQDGRDVMPELPVEELETVFVKDLTYEGDPNPNEPSRQMAQKHPASGVSFNIGVLYNVGPGVKLPPGNPRPDKGVAPPPGRGIGRAVDKIKSPVNEKVKASAVNAVCLNCPPVALKITSNNDGEVFPEEDIEVKPYGSWGGAQLDNLTTEESVIICTTCPGSGEACCCQLASLHVKLTFKMRLNEKRIEKGVWMNTNPANTKEFGHTYVGAKLPRRIKNQEEWKKVDRQSVEVHERQHFVDFQEAIREALVEELKRFVVVQYPCSPASEEHCKKQVANQMKAIASRLKELAKTITKDIAKAENKEYMSGDFEIRARNVQAAELNSRK